MKKHLCYCGGCDKILVDYNPQGGAPKFRDRGYKELRMIDIYNAKEDILEESFWGCPNCLSDEFLGDVDEENYEEVLEKYSK